MKRRAAALLMCFALAFTSVSDYGSFAYVQAEESVVSSVTGEPEDGTSDETEQPPEADDSIAIDETNFPDEYFRKYVLGQLEGTTSLDTDGDGRLSVEERNAVTFISIDGEPVKDLMGIEYFPELSYLGMGGVALTAIDLSHNTKIAKIHLYRNQNLTELHLEGCRNLTSLSVNDCNIAVLDFGEMEQLTELTVNDNQLTELNLAAMPNLTTLNCNNNQIEVLDISANPKLVRLDCQGNRLTELDVTGLAGLQRLFCDDNRITELDVTQNPELRQLTCSKNRLKKLDISRNPKLKSINIDENYITSLDTSANVELEWTKSLPFWSTLQIDSWLTEQEDGSWLLDLSGQDGYNPEKTTIVDWPYSKNVPELTEEGVVWKENPVEGEPLLYLEYDLSNGYYIDGKALRCRYGLKRSGSIFDTTEVALTKENFPDDKFREKLEYKFGIKEGETFQPGKYAELNLGALYEIEDLKGIEYFTALSKFYLNDTSSRLKVDLSKNKNLTEMDIYGANIRYLDLRNNPNIQNIRFGDLELTSLYLAEGCAKNANFHSLITETAVEENGRYFLDFSEYGGLDEKRIVGLVDGDIEGDRIYWNSKEEVPTYFTYDFLLYSDYEEGMEYSDDDVLSVRFILTNNQPEKMKGKEIELSEESFPSPQLLNCLKKDYDGNNDGILNTEDVRTLSLEGKGVTSLAGIEHLNCLQDLSIYMGSFTELDLSANTILKNLYLENGSLTNLDISGCPYLEKANLYGNSLTEIDTSKNKALCELNLSNNAIKELDLRNNKNLQELELYGNLLKSLDVSQNMKLNSLNCSSNQRLEELKFPAQGMKMKKLFVSGSRITSLPVSEMPNLTELSVDFNQNNFTELDVTNNTKLEKLYVKDVSLKTDWTKMKALKNLTVYTTDPEWKQLDLSVLANLTSCWLKVDSMTDLDVHGCKKLSDLTIENGVLQRLDLTGCTALLSLRCYDNKLTELNVTDCIALKSLECGRNELESLDVTKNTALQDLRCWGNHLETIDTTQNPALKWLECFGNPITHLDLSNNKAMLTDLNCVNASLTSLDVEENTVLENVDLENQVFEASAEDIQPEAGTQQRGAMRGEENTKLGAGTAGYVLRLDQYGDFDPKRVSGLSSGAITEGGIMWKDKSQIPAEVTYTYHISNEYKLSGKSMPVKINLISALEDMGLIRQISSCTITVASGSVYTGKPQKPAVTVKDGNYVLVQNKDYTLSYINSTHPTDEAVVVVKGKGVYKGSVSKTYVIKKAPQTISCNTSYQKTYGSKAFSLKVKRRKGNGKITYTTSDKKIAAVSKGGKVTPKNMGIATITVNVSSTKDYEELNVKITVKVTPAKQTIKSSKATAGKKLSISWKKDKKVTGYQIQCSTDKKFKKNLKKVKISKNKTTSATVKKLKPGKKYYVRVRSYKEVKSGGKKQTVYGTWSNAKRSGKIKK